MECTTYCRVKNHDHFKWHPIREVNIAMLLRTCNGYDPRSTIYGNNNNPSSKIPQMLFTLISTCYVLSDVFGGGSILVGAITAWV